MAIFSMLAIQKEKEIKTGHRYTCLVFAMLLLLSHNSLADKYDDLVTQFCRDMEIVSLQIGGTPWALDSYREIEASGANVLDALARRLNERNDKGQVELQLVGCFLNTSRVKWYEYVEPGNELADRFPVETDPATVPFLSLHLGQYQDGVGMLRSWWEERTHFLEQIRCEEFKEITCLSIDQAVQHTEARDFKLRRSFGIYGIYAIPCYVANIADHNNPVAFLEFLKATGNQLGYQVRGISEPVVQLQNSFPTKEDKMTLVCAWWEEAAPTFTELADLHAAIDKEIRAYCAESEAEEAQARKIRTSERTGSGSLSRASTRVSENWGTLPDCLSLIPLVFSRGCEGPVSVLC